MKIRLVWLTMVFVFAASMSCYATTFYVDGSAVSDSGNGSISSPKKYLQSGISLMSGGDTLIIRDGTYTQSLTGVPSGSANNYTNVKAENNFGVKIVCASALNITSLSSYIRIEGIKFNNNNGLSSIIQASNHIKIIRCSFTGSQSSANVMTITVNSSSYILLEECWAWGTGRYKFLVYESDHVILRRCVSRHDYHNDTQCATFTRYDSPNVEFQNCIAIDSGLTDGSNGGFYGGIWNENNAEEDTTGKDLGCIILNIKGASGLSDWKVKGIRTIENCVIWDAPSGIFAGDYRDLEGQMYINHTTIGSMATGAPETSGTGIINSIGMPVCSIINSIITQCNKVGINAVTATDYNCLFGNLTNYSGVSTGAHDITSNPALKYLVRIETDSACKGTAADSSDRGATILKRYGVSETLWGETGYETLTNDSLWPFPNEAEIRSDMRTWAGGYVSGTRGFCADGQTLTKYIWEYLGNPIPAEIYGGTQNNSPIASASVNQNSGVAPLIVNFTGSGTDSDGAIISYSWNFGDSTSSASQSPTHTYSSAGIYTAVLTVTDNDGATDTDSVVITVSGVAQVGQTYYVSSSGLDSNTGTQSLPWRTLQHASDVAVAGDIVLVNDGTYAGFCNWSNSGTVSDPITYKANGSNVIINSRNPNTIDNINIENVDYIIIDGFKIQNSQRAGIRVVNSTGVIVKNCICSNSEYWGIFTGFAPAVQILNNFCSASAREHGIYVSNSNMSPDAPIISGNTCYNNYQNGIQINGDLYSGGDGIISAGIIEKNIVHDNGYKGLSLISMQDSIVKNNIIYNNGTRNAGAGGIHLVEEPGTGQHSNNNLIVNNTVIEPRIAGIRMNSGSTNNTVFNNIVVSSSQIVDEDGGNYIDTTSNAKSSSTSGLFVNPTINDYHLSNSSIAKDLGKSSYNSKNAPTQDFDGNSRPQGSAYDSGAYENTSVVVADTTAPSAISNLSVTGTTTSSASLRWTAPGDDAGVGTAAIYDVRRSTATITTANWASATQVSGEPTPSVAGTVQTMTVSGLNASTTYYFAMKVSDEVPNISALSNVASSATTALADTTAPYTSNKVPLANAINIQTDANIIVHVKDDGAGVDINTIVMRVNGVIVTPTITGTPADYTLTYDPPADFDTGQEITVTVNASDLAP
ncbi:MAG: right-handed parallel beta-helix repeat-containing protein [Candidatus Omnitrophica bacterium]|nr:right-handed parallel beta-helix repeat-containing protein [Candidatus Omnitrophota bacterium]